ncbi:MAG: esterase/lipase family protein [Massilia sp.]
MRSTVFSRARTIFLLLYALLCLCGCDKAPAHNDEDPGWVDQARPPHRIAVVFVHGIFGSTRGTWTNDNGESFFSLLKKDETLGPQVDTYAFGFKSSMMQSGSLDIREAAIKLQRYLETDQVMRHDAVVFVGHSMGGLVVMRYLANNLDKDAALAARVPLILLFGTPMEGAQIASLGKLVLSNPALSHLQPADSNDALKQLNDDWAALGASVRPWVSCAYETATIGGVRIVPQTSATRVCDDRPLAIDGADHIALVKPDRPRHPAFMLLKHDLTERVIPLNFQAKLEFPDFNKDATAQGSTYTYKLDAPERQVRVMNTGRASIRYWVANKSQDALMIYPGQSQEIISGRGNANLTMALRVDANSGPYEFHVKTDAPSDDLIQVNVSDLDKIRAWHRETALAVGDSLNRYFKDNEQEVAGLQDRPDLLNARLAGIAYEAVAHRLVDMPAGQRWLLTADILTAAQLNTVASSALAVLRSDATVSPSVVNGIARKVETQIAVDAQLRALAEQKRLEQLEARPNQRNMGSEGPTAHEVPSLPAWLNDDAYHAVSLRLSENMKQIKTLRVDAASLEIATKAINEETAKEILVRAKAEQLRPTTPEKFERPLPSEGPIPKSPNLDRFRQQERDRRFQNNR